MAAPTSSDCAREDVDRLADDLKKASLKANMTDSEREALEALEKQHEKHVAVEREYQVELRALKKRYREKFVPLYRDRCNVLSEAHDAKHGTSIRNFWLEAMKHHPMLNDMIESDDEKVLAHLQNIEGNWLDGEPDKAGFELMFQFSDNPYFEPNVLTKTYLMETPADGGDDAAPVFCEATSSAIQWKLGQDVTKKTVTRRQKNKRTKQIRKLTETVSVPSFFNFFTNLEFPDEERLDNMTEEEVEKLEVTVEADYEAGVIIRDKIIPHAVLWYTGDARDSDMEDDETDDDEEYDDDLRTDSDSDGEEEEEDDEDDEDDKSKKKERYSTRYFRHGG